MSNSDTKVVSGRVIELWIHQINSDSTTSGFNSSPSQEPFVRWKVTLTGSLVQIKRRMVI
jgi:hypothetical protein